MSRANGIRKLSAEKLAISGASNVWRRRDREAKKVNIETEVCGNDGKYYSPSRSSLSHVQFLEVHDLCKLTATFVESLHREKNTPPY
jgi:hypothetical protein